ncbi:MAG: agmatine deiminase family protein [Rhodobacter sp.]|nr:agmatine deiminase family protein [Rhodobacter sp.]
MTDVRSSPPVRLVVPDYAPPSALAVPLFHFDTRATLEALARAAAYHVGVILIGPDGPALRDFADKTETPGHFAVLTAEIDSPWLRDHAPVAVVENRRALQVLPRHERADRPRDTALFSNLMSIPTERTELHLAAGNTVRGPNGLAISTLRVLSDNGLDTDQGLRTTGVQMGIHRWLLVPAYDDDLSAHTDCMVRFLSPHLCAMVRRTDRPDTQTPADALAAAIADACPGIRILDIPARAFGESFDSPVNWVQLGRTILLPDYGAPDPNHAPTAGILAAEGFAVVPVASGTSGLGGGLHCLSASIYTEAPETVPPEPE